MGDPTVHFLMFVRVISNRSPSLSTSIERSFFGTNAVKKLSAPERTSSTAVPPASTSSAAVTPFLAGMPPKSKAFSTCSVSRCHDASPDASCAVYESTQRICCAFKPAAHAAAAADPKVPDSACVLRWLSTMYCSFPSVAVNRVPTSYPSATARRNRCPSLPHFSPTASAAGTTEQPGCDCDGGCVSSVSSECASMPLASAASIGPQTTVLPATAETRSPPYDLAKLIANFPGGSSDPEIAAASVSRIMCFVFSTTASGSGRRAASAM